MNEVAPVVTEEAPEKSYVGKNGVAVPTMADLVKSYNDIAGLIGRPLVNKFENKEIAIRRLNGILVELAAIDAEDQRQKLEQEKKATIIPDDETVEALIAPFTKLEETAKKEVERIKSTGKFRKSLYNGKRIFPVKKDFPHDTSSILGRAMLPVWNNPGLTYEEFILAGGVPKHFRFDLYAGLIRIE